MATPATPREFDKWMRDIESRIAQVEKRDAFINTAFSVPSAGVTQVTGTLIVDGTIESSNYDGATQGWAQSNAEITSFTAIRGFVGGQSVGTSAQGFGLTTTKASLASTTVAVPHGFTQCNVFGFAQLYMVNPNTTGGSNSTGGDAIYAQAFLGSQYSQAFPQGISGGNGFATATTGWSFSQTGLAAGSSITVSVSGWSGYQAIAAGSSNSAIVCGTVQWLP